MKILVIDNGTSYLSRLKALLADYDFRVVGYSQINAVNPNDFDAIILSGGHDFSVVGNESRIEKEVDLVKNYGKPIFGICFGFEVIAHAFGARLALMQDKEVGLLDINIEVPDQIFSGIPNFKVFESHRWVVEGLPEELIALARSKDGVEVIKHRSRPIYGAQFHPEMFVEKTCGDEILYNFLNLAKQYIN